MSGDVVHIALAADAGYVPHLAATIASVHSSTSRPLKITVMHDGISAGDRQKIEGVAQRAQFEWIGVDDERLLSLIGNEHFASRATFFRLALPHLMAPDAIRVIYLDSDLVLTRDIGGLFDTSLAGRPVGAIEDTGVDARDFARQWQITGSRMRYFNAGVLLIDLRHPETGTLFESATEFAITHRGALPYCDQDALNYTLWNHWHPIDPIWNLQRNIVLADAATAFPEGYDAHRRPGVIHFTTAEKPWRAGTYHPYGWLYWRNLARTPYLRTVMRDNAVGPLTLARWLARYLKHWPRFSFARRIEFESMSPSRLPGGRTT